MPLRPRNRFTDPPPPPKTQPMNIRLTPQEKKLLRKYANKEDRDLAPFCVMILRKWLEEKENPQPCGIPQYPSRDGSLV